MRVFLSWSGARSKAVAELLRDWICCVLQATRPWISTRDLDRGSIWFGEINDQLRDTSVGIICLTQENKDRPWILFEAGALTKGLSSARVCTLLVDLAPKDVEDPLAQFHHTFPTRDSMFELVKSLNRLLDEDCLEPMVLETVFETYWRQFEIGFQNILTTIGPIEDVIPRKDSDILAEILEITRQVFGHVSNLGTRVGEDSDAIGIRRAQRLEAAKKLVGELSSSNLSHAAKFARLMGRGIHYQIASEALNSVEVNKRECATSCGSYSAPS